MPLKSPAVELRFYWALKKPSRYCFMRRLSLSCFLLVKPFWVTSLGSVWEAKAPTSAGTLFYPNVSAVTKWFAVFPVSRGQPYECIVQVITT